VKNLSNPFSTGGGGGNFETRVQASFAVLMLAGGFSPCLRPWRIAAINLQGKHRGIETDDIVVEVQEDGTSRSGKLLAQVKHDISFTERDKVLAEVLKAALTDFRASFDPALDAIALVTGPLSGADLELRTVLEWARTSPSADEFFKKVELANFSSANKRKKLKAVLQHLQNANGKKPLENEEAWNFLKTFHILQYDLDIANGVNRVFLSCIISQFDTLNAEGILAQLIEAIRDINQSAGSVTVGTLPPTLVEAFQRRPKATMPPELLRLAIAPTPAAATAFIPSFEVAIAQFVGSWNEASENDCKYVSELAEESYSDFVRKLSVQLNTPGTPLKHVGGVWSVNNRAECWETYGSYIFDRHLSLLQDNAVKALGPSLDQTPQDLASDPTIEYSPGLQAAFAETLAFVGTSGAFLTRCQKDAVHMLPGLVVRKIIDPKDWRNFANLSDHLPTLAEAAPVAFLSSVEQATLQGNTIGQLFGQQGGGIFGKNYSVGLLWALESLAWSADYLSRVTIILGALNELDPGGRWTNRPINSLKDIFLAWHPQTSAAPEIRFAAVRALSLEYSDAAWQVFISSLPGKMQSTSGTHKPNWHREWATSADLPITNGEYRDTLSDYTEGVLQLAKRDHTKIVDLIDNLGNLPDGYFEKATQLIQDHSKNIEKTASSYSVWNKLLEIVRKHRMFSTAAWAMPKERVDEIEAIAGHFRPESPSDIFKNLFGHADVGPYDPQDNLDEREKKIENVQSHAVQEILSYEGLNAISEFAKEVHRPRAVGYALSKVEGEHLSKKYLQGLGASDDQNLHELLHGIVAGAYSSKGVEWIQALGLKSWSREAASQILLALPFNANTWRLVENILGRHQALYWKRVDARFLDADSDVQFTVKKLIQHQRPVSAVNVLHSYWFKHRTLLVAEAVQALLAAANSDEKTSQMDEYAVETLIAQLQNSNAVSEDKVAEVEWAYLDLLDRVGIEGTPKTLERKLADDPAYFIHLITSIFQAKDQLPGPDPTDQERKFATKAYGLLMNWRVPPGMEPDGTFNGERYSNWLKTVVEGTRESGHLDVALIQIGKVLVHVPKSDGGLWINEAVAQSLNTPEFEALRSGYRSGLFNSRGVYWVDPSGAPERKLASSYRQKALDAEIAGYIRLATAMKALADEYNHQADTVKSTYGLDGVEET
jgi:hypothetical protein